MISILKSAEGVTHIFQLNYDKTTGIVSYVNNSVIDSIGKSQDEFTIMNNVIDAMWMLDIIRVAGDLYLYSESDVNDFITRMTDNHDSYSLATDGIEVDSFEFTYTEENEYGTTNVSNTSVVSYKLDLVNGFGGLEECPDRIDSEQPSVSEPESSEVVPQPAPETPKEQPQEEIENPSTGDIQVYKVVGGIAVCMMLAIGAAIHLRKKEEII